MLPAGLCSLSSLKELTLRDLTIMETLPDELGTLCFLERLTIRRCDALQTLPNSLSAALFGLDVYVRDYIF
ncbi:unnamed protein product [Calypogeia fissa]